MSDPAEALSRQNKIRAGRHASTTLMLGQIATAVEDTMYSRSAQTDVTQVDTEREIGHVE